METAQYTDKGLKIRPMLGGLSKEIPHLGTSYDKQGYIGTFSYLNPNRAQRLRNLFQIRAVVQWSKF